MKTKKLWGGAVVLSLALSLTAAGGAWAQSQERGYGSSSGSSGADSGGRYDKDKKQTGSKKSAEENAPGLCTPKSCGPKTPKGGAGSGSQPENSK